MTDIRRMRGQAFRNGALLGFGAAYAMFGFTLGAPLFLLLGVAAVILGLWLERRQRAQISQ